MWRAALVATTMVACLLPVRASTGSARTASGPFVLSSSKDERSTQSTPPLSTILARAAGYVDRFAARFAALTAEEVYTQQSGRSRRTLRSDFVLVWPIDGDGWIAFRDVFEVDGKPVREREERLKTLFVQAPDIAVAGAASIQQESGPYTIGPIYSEVSVPTLPLLVLHASNQRHFAFELRATEGVGGVSARRIDYVEKDVPSIIQRMGADVPMSGSAWVEPDSGAIVKGVVKTRFRVVRTFTRIEVTTTYVRSPKSDADLYLPDQMSERYEFPLDELRGVGRYTNIRPLDTGARVRSPR